MRVWLLASANLFAAFRFLFCRLSLYPRLFASFSVHWAAFVKVHTHHGRLPGCWGSDSPALFRQQYK